MERVYNFMSLQSRNLLTHFNHEKIIIKSVRIRSSGNLHIQFECVKIRTRKTPDTDLFYAVHITPVFHVTNTY